MSTYMISWEIKTERHQKQAHLHDFTGKEMKNKEVFHIQSPGEGNASVPGPPCVSCVLTGNFSGSPAPNASEDLGM